MWSKEKRKKYIRKYMREYRNMTAYKKYLKEYQKKYRASHRKELSEYSNEFRRNNLKYYLKLSKRHQLKNPEKYKARQVFFRAMIKISIGKKHCLLCGKKAEAHHLDYNDPFKVLWLCHKHNIGLHRNLISPVIIKTINQAKPF